MAGTSTEIRFEEEHCAAIITLDRPSALNALNEEMRAGIPSRLEKWARDPEIYAMIIRAVGERAFCAGGDVRELYAQGREGTALKALKAEYSLNWLFERFTKPTISLINGMVMGSGVGISRFGTHRVAGENYSFAMPEAAIGFFPDVGATWFLSHLDDEIGTYLAMTGARIGRADAFALGLASHCIDGDKYEGIIEHIADADPVDPLLDDLHVDPGEGALAPLRAEIRRCFSGDTVADIVAKLENISGTHAEWRDKTLEKLTGNSPMSVHVALRQMRVGRDLDLRQALQLEYRLAARFLSDNDFYEGVRANLIDKDYKPEWKPASLADVTAEMVDAYFCDDGDHDLELAAPSDTDISNI